MSYLNTVIKRSKKIFEAFKTSCKRNLAPYVAPSAAVILTNQIVLSLISLERRPLLRLHTLTGGGIKNNLTKSY